MITIDLYRDSFKQNRDAFRETVKGWRIAAAALDEIQAADYQAGRIPAETVKKFVAATDEKMARFIIASLVNQSAWDGRIFPNVVEWAAGVADALDEETAIAAGIFSKMHRAHLNQIAQAMMEYRPEPEPAADSDTAALPEFKSISVHTDALDVITEYAPALLDVLTADEQNALANLAEWDGLQFFVFDIAPKSEWHAHRYFVTVTDGFNASNTQALEEFAAESIKAAKEWADEWGD